MAQDRIAALVAHVADVDVALDDETMTPRDKATLLAERRKALETLHRMQGEIDEDSHVIELTDRVADLERTLASGRSGGQVRASAAPVLARSGDDRH